MGEFKKENTIIQTSKTEFNGFPVCCSYFFSYLFFVLVSIFYVCSFQCVCVCVVDRFGPSVKCCLNDASSIVS